MVETPPFVSDGNTTEIEGGKKAIDRGAGRADRKTYETSGNKRGGKRRSERPVMHGENKGIC